MMIIKKAFLQWFTTFLIKNSSSSNTSAGGIKIETMSKQQLSEKFYKPIIRKFEKRKVPSSFIDNIWGVDLQELIKQ